ncbi:MAG: M48 family metallopeptidase [Deltaproteobacteria bacterium]|nr:M48 family metallopeptidase [Deltaproteobacteria bacterium]
MIQRYRDIEYALKRSNRKTASIYIERDGQISILVPEQLTDQQVEQLIESKRKWIYTNLAEWRDLNATRVRREYVNGEGFLYLGRTYRLKLVETQDKPLMLKNGYFCLRISNGIALDADAAFKEFFREKGKKRISARVLCFQTKMGVQPKALRVIELKNRWASCSLRGNLNFHWKCMMAPPTMLDYIVVHELAHLIHANHTEAFWNEVDKVMPDYRDRKEWLRVNGAGMDL